MTPNERYAQLVADAYAIQRRAGEIIAELKHFAPPGFDTPAEGVTHTQAEGRRASAAPRECEVTAATNGPQAAVDAAPLARANADNKRHCESILETWRKLNVGPRRRTAKAIDDMAAITEQVKDGELTPLEGLRRIATSLNVPELLHVVVEGKSKIAPLIAQELDVDLGPVAGWADQKPFAKRDEPLRFNCSKVVEVGDQCEDVDTGMRSMRGTMEVVAIDREQKLVTTKMVAANYDANLGVLRVIKAKALQYVPKVEQKFHVVDKAEPAAVPTIAPPAQKYISGEEPQLNDEVNAPIDRIASTAIVDGISWGSGLVKVKSIFVKDMYGYFEPRWVRIDECRLIERASHKPAPETKREPTIVHESTAGTDPSSPFKKFFVTYSDGHVAKRGDTVKHASNPRIFVAQVFTNGLIQDVGMRQYRAEECVLLTRGTTIEEPEAEKPLLDRYAEETAPIDDRTILATIGGVPVRTGDQIKDGTHCDVVVISYEDEEGMLMCYCLTHHEPFMLREAMVRQIITAKDPQAATKQARDVVINNWHQFKDPKFGKLGREFVKAFEEKMAELKPDDRPVLCTLSDGTEVRKGDLVDDGRGSDPCRGHVRAVEMVGPLLMVHCERCRVSVRKVLGNIKGYKPQPAPTAEQGQGQSDGTQDDGQVLKATAAEALVKLGKHLQKRLETVKEMVGAKPLPTERPSRRKSRKTAANRRQLTSKQRKTLGPALSRAVEDLAKPAKTRAKQRKPQAKTSKPRRNPGIR